MQVLSEGSLLAQVFYQVMSRLHLRVWELCHWGEELPFMIHPNMIRALLLKNYMRKCLHLKNMTEKTLLMTLQLMKLINYTHKLFVRDWYNFPMRFQAYLFLFQETSAIDQESHIVFAMRL